MINNNIELWTSIYGEHTLNESEAEAAITKSVFKYTEADADAEGVEEWHIANGE